MSRNNQQNAKNNRVTNKNVSASEKAENQSTEKNKRKPKIFLVGDSMVCDIKGWLISRNKTVKVNGFPGSTTEDMESFLSHFLNVNQIKSCFMLERTIKSLIALSKLQTKFWI